MLPDINSVGIFQDKSGSSLIANSGRRVSVWAPQPDQIHLSDASHALSLQCRYNGQTDRFYSVAEHTLKGFIILVAERASDTVLKAWLLHDVSEAFIGDVTRPVKLYLDTFKEIEEGFLNVIYEKYGVPRASTEAAVYRMDNIMCALEKHHLIKNGGDWPGLPEVDFSAPKYLFDVWGTPWEDCKTALGQLFTMYFGEG